MSTGSSPRRRRLVVDTNICLDLLLFDDPACAGWLNDAASGHLELVTDRPCRDEWRRVLGYDALRLDSHQQHVLDLRHTAIWTVWSEAGQPASRHDGRDALPRCRDADDQKFLELAVRCQAHAVISRDRELLRLDARCRRVAGFAVLTPQQWTTVSEDENRT